MNSAQLTDSQDETAKLVLMLTKLSVDVHRSSQEAATCFFKELKRCCYATPSAYIECIQVFLKIFAQKQTEYTKYRERLSAGILKLDRSHELVGKMQQELIELGPELEQKAEVIAQGYDLCLRNGSWFGVFHRVMDARGKLGGRENA